MSEPRIVAITTARDEVDIIEAFVRHTLALAERLAVLDNGSTDGTPDVLRALADEGLPLEIVEDPSIGKYRARRMTRLLKELALDRWNADWVLAIDADEFVVVPKGESLVPPGATGAQTIWLPSRTYAPHRRDDPSEPNPVLRIRHYLEGEPKAGKVLVPAKLAALPGAKLRGHDLFLDDQRCKAAPGPAFLAHFPYRSPGQFLSKTAITALQYQARPDRRDISGQHYQSLFAELKRDPEAFAATLDEAVEHYWLRWTEKRAGPEAVRVLDPLPYRGGPLRYTPRCGDLAHAYRNLAAYAEQLARQHAVLASFVDEDGSRAPDEQRELVARLNAELTSAQEKVVNTQLRLKKLQRRPRAHHLPWHRRALRRGRRILRRLAPR